MKTSRIITATALLLLTGAPTARAEVQHYQFNEVNSTTWAIDDPWQPEGFDKAIIVDAPFVKSAPDIDGRADDPAWAHVDSVTVPLAYGSVKEASVKAVYSEDEVFLLVSWADPTRDDQYHPWIWSDAQKRYVEGAQVEDSLLVSFEGGCEWTPSLLSGYVYDYDGWRWLAARTNPLGQAVDVEGHAQDRWVRNKGFEKYPARASGPTWQLKFSDPRPGILTLPWYEVKRAYMLQPIATEVYVGMEPDGYKPPAFVARVDAPEIEPARMEAKGILGPDPAYAAVPPLQLPQYQPVKLEGDAGEVSARGRWEDGRWTVEFRRARVTPARTRNDWVFDRVTQFSLYVFDHTERIDEAGESGRLWLQFAPVAD